MLDTTSTDFDGKPESRYLAESIKTVADHYPQSYLDQKTIDWFNLLQALFAVYGTRFFAMKMQRDAAKAERRTMARPAGVQSATPPQHHTPQGNGGATPEDTSEFNRGTIPGLGDINFPADHPLAAKPDPKKPH